MKRAICIFLTLAFSCGLLCGCTSKEQKQYEQALACYDAKDYAGAAALLEGLDYEDAERYLADCRIMEAIEESVLFRMKANPETDEEIINAINTEKAYLEPVISAAVHNENIKLIVQQYVRGLNRQKAAFQKEYIDAQIEYYEGTLMRYSSLGELYRNYGLLKDNREFVGIYINGFKDIQNDLERLKAVDRSLSEWWRSAEPKYGTYSIKTSWTNNSGFSASVLFTLIFWNEGKTERVGDSSLYVENVKNGETVKLDFYAPVSSHYVYYIYWQIVD